MSSIAISKTSAVETLASSADALHALANRIKERDCIVEKYAHSKWLENGRDLLKAKSILGHGKFEEWCDRTLNYTPRTAQKLMRAAQVWGPILETESSSVFPKPTIVYALSAPSVSQAIRETYIPRVIAGENIGAELSIAIKDYRQALKTARDREPHLAAKSSEVLVEGDAANARYETCDADQCQSKQEERTVARKAALAIIIARVGDDFPVFMTRVMAAGSGAVFSLDTERELQVLMQQMAVPTPEEAKGNEAEGGETPTSEVEENFAPKEDQQTAPVLMETLVGLKPTCLSALKADQNSSDETRGQPPDWKRVDSGPVMAPIRTGAWKVKDLTVPKPRRSDHVSNFKSGSPTKNLV